LVQKKAVTMIFKATPDTERIYQVESMNSLDISDIIMMGAIGMNRICTGKNGSIENIIFNENGKELCLPFTKNSEYSGPCWYAIYKNKEYRIEMNSIEDNVFEGKKDNIAYSIKYCMDGNKAIIEACIKNSSDEAFLPEKVGIKLGIDTYMDSYPEWNDKFFPTLLRCEKNFFWGYFMSPMKKIIGICSPNAAASWSMDYNEVNGYGGHRIHTVNIDLLNNASLPDRHPDTLKQLMPGEEKKWMFYLAPVDRLENVKACLSQTCNIPMIEVDRYTVSKKEQINIRVISELDTEVFIVKPGDSKRTCIGKTNSGCKTIAYDKNEACGVYKLYVVDSNGYEAEARIYVRKEWSWYLIGARKEAVRMEQKASTHLESWYGCFTNFLAAKHFPDEELDIKAKENFDEILPLMYDVEKCEPIVMAKRICNTACMIGLLVDLYEANSNIKYLEIASGLADWLTHKQGKDGAYRTETGWSSGREDSLGEHYTCVIYMAKSMLELVVVEKQLGKSDAAWNEKYLRHYKSAKAAIDDLENRKDDIGTEGEHTFEDGMISCSSLQLGMFALLQEDEAEKEKYKAAAEYMIKKHACLEQTLIPDCRMNGCTIRYWEAQYDVLLDKNMINSPHGWTSWKTYATWYLYQLTGKIKYLKETMDTLGACMQLLDLETGRLRWAFIADPCITANIWTENTEHSGKGRRTCKVFGEDYAEMISGWYKRPEGEVSVHKKINSARQSGDDLLPEDGWCCDNDVHENFKCLEEVALTSAYVAEEEDGSIVAWNCTCKTEGNNIHVYPSEDVVSSLHLNMKSKHSIKIYFADNTKELSEYVGMKWVRKA